MYSHFDTQQLAAQMDGRVGQLLGDSWATRVAVRTAQLDAASYYDGTVPDFPPELVPFCRDPRWEAMAPTLRQKLLAGAWVAYNEKTIDVEVNIVVPACALLLRGALAGAQGATLKRVIAQTQVDEQFHILMCLEACLLSRQMHGIEALPMPQSLVVRRLKAALEGAGAREAAIIQFGYATVAEVTINDYLALLAHHRGIQPFNRETTDLHRKDEAAHHRVFKELARGVYHHFSSAERAVFVAALSDGLDAFVSTDLNAWHSILAFLGVAEAGDIIARCRLPGMGMPRVLRDYSGFRSLLSELGLDEADIAFEFEPAACAPAPTAQQ